MDFKAEIKERLKNGATWEDIANSFAGAMNDVHAEAESDQNNIVENILFDLVNYYGEESSLGKLLSNMSVEEAKRLLDGFGETYATIEQLTFPLRDLVSHKDKD